jgi:hypothetical protein
VTSGKSSYSQVPPCIPGTAVSFVLTTLQSIPHAVGYTRYSHTTGLNRPSYTRLSSALFDFGTPTSPVVMCADDISELTSTDPAMYTRWLIACRALQANPADNGKTNVSLNIAHHFITFLQSIQSTS